MLIPSAGHPEYQRDLPMKICLIVWTIAAFGWWATALVLLSGCARRRLSVALAAGRPKVSLFKPLPPVSHEREREILSEAVGTFIRQLQPGDEMLVGVDIQAVPAWQSHLDRWRQRWPAAQINVVAQEVPSHCANPKIAWMQVLAPAAHGEIWLWSDTDVFAAPDFLDTICRRLATTGANAVTAPYRIQQADAAHEMLDTLFVNAEFLPGALLLDRLEQQDYAYGAATAFRAETFHNRCDWQQLGAALADDHTLGEQLQPVALADSLVSTVPILNGWGAAVRHYYRWHKTVRWCRPSGYAAMILLLPVLGWAGLAMFAPGHGFYLSGLAGVFLAETMVAVTACRLVGCRLPVTTWFGIVLWPFARPLVWLLVWLPFPVSWSGQKKTWSAPQQT
jgi:ceramide glucosyltransferase